MKKIILPKDKERLDAIREDLDKYLDNIDFDDIEDGLDTRRYQEKEYLEAILFDTYEDDKKRKFKRIGFRSKNLCKLDLREVSFEDVSFNGEDYPDLEEGERIDLSNTNARIDFSKSYEYKTTGQVVLKSVDFHGTNLSRNNWHDLTNKCFAFIKNCNFADTHSSLTDEGRKVYLKINGTDLSNNDLSDISINYDKQLSLSPEITFISCIFTKTGINVEYRGNDKGTIREIVTDPNYKGCKYNGRPIRTKDEIDELKHKGMAKIMKSQLLGTNK